MERLVQASSGEVPRLASEATRLAEVHEVRKPCQRAIAAIFKLGPLGISVFTTQ